MTSNTRNYRNRFISLPARLNCHFHSFLPNCNKAMEFTTLYSVTDLNSFVNKLNIVIVFALLYAHKSSLLHEACALAIKKNLIVALYLTKIFNPH